MIAVLLRFCPVDREQDIRITELPDRVIFGCMIDLYDKMIPVGRPSFRDQPHAGGIVVLDIGYNHGFRLLVDERDQVFHGSRRILRVLEEALLRLRFRHRPFERFSIHRDLLPVMGTDDIAVRGFEQVHFQKTGFPVFPVVLKRLHAVGHMDFFAVISRKRPSGMKDKSVFMNRLPHGQDCAFPAGALCIPHRRK